VLPLAAAGLGVAAGAGAAGVLDEESPDDVDVEAAPDVEPDVDDVSLAAVEDEALDPLDPRLSVL
jgi:hypothetical protein